MRLCVTLLTCCLLAPAVQAQVIDFEDLGLPANSFRNGSANVVPPATVSTTPFVSRGASFNNRYDTAFGGTWAGWSISSKTDTTTAGFGNQYSAYNLPGGGGDSSATYGVAFQDTFTPVTPTVQLPAGTRPLSVRLTNVTYAALSMRDGDSFAKKFGGATGNDPDFLRLTIRGFDAVNAPTGTIEFYLADYRFANNALDYIVSQWTTVNLTPLANAAQLTFALDSSDNGPFGMNTPAYFTLDNLMLTPIPEPGSFALCAAAIGIGWYRRRQERSQRPFAIGGSLLVHPQQ
ncbi:MAG: DUF4465 domain-containing protein [Gemmataceae bacterium]